MAEESLGTVARAIQILRSLAEAEEDVTIAGLAEQVDLPRPTVHRLLQLLREQGMAAVDPDTRRYRTGTEFYRLAALVMRQKTINDIARPIMERVVAECSESCLLGLYLPADHKMAFAEQVESPHALRFSIPLNVPLPLEWGCSGRVILAHLPEPDIDAVIAASRPSPVTGRNLPSAKRFKQELAQIREQGYDVTLGEKIPDSRGIGAPVMAAGNRVVGSLNLTIPASRFEQLDRGALIALICTHAQELSVALGHRAPSVAA
jgi:DNA-binding IclR family transcriptional regulator